MNPILIDFNDSYFRNDIKLESKTIVGSVNYNYFDSSYTYRVKFLFI
jgi:hypothetical protein